MPAKSRVIVGLVLALSVMPVLTMSPAPAHFCSQPLEVPVGRPVTFTVGVPAEDVPVARVDIEVPPGFELHRAVEFAGWRAQRVGNVVRYEGGQIRLLMCAFFTLAGEAPEETVLVVPFVTYDAGGQVLQEFRSKSLNEVNAAQLVYAGMKWGAVEEAHGSNRDAIAVAGWALMRRGALGGFFVFRRHRRGSLR